MKNLIKYTYILLFLLPSLLFSETGIISLPFLEIAQSPSSAAWQQGGYAIGNGAMDVNCNPAITALQDYTELMIHYQMLPFDNTIQQILYTKPTLIGTIGGSVVFSGQQDLKVYDSNFNLSTVSSYDLAASFFHSVSFYDISVGTKTTIIRSKLADYSALTFAIDWGGVFYLDVPSIFERGKNSNLGVGISVKGLSPGIRYGAVNYPIPLLYGGGIYYNLTNFSYLESNLEMFYTRSHQIYHSIGSALEFKTLKYFTLRGGISYHIYDESKIKELTFSGGISVLLSVRGYIYDLAYSVEPSTDLGIQHQFALRVQFGGGEKWPLGVDRLFSIFNRKNTTENLSIREVINTEIKAQKSEDDDQGISEKDKLILYLLRNSIAKFNKQRGRFPTDLNELLLFLNDYHVYEIPNPKVGKYRYNKRTGKLFIRK